MATEEDETTVNESYAVTIPAAVRDDIDLEPGDRLRWDVDADGRLVAEIVRERYGAFEDLEPVDIDEETDAVEATESYEWS
jgi:AbrB family looped-hinge helix DNA binding protein